MIEASQQIDVKQSLAKAIKDLDKKKYEKVIELCKTCIDYLEASRQDNNNKQPPNNGSLSTSFKNPKHNARTTSISSIFTSSIKKLPLTKKIDSNPDTQDSIPESDKQLAQAYCLRNLAENLFYKDHITVIGFNNAIELFPQYVNAYCNRARAYYKLRNLEGALNDLNTAIEYDRKKYKAYYYRGKVNYLNGEYPKAHDDFKKTIDFIVEHATDHPDFKESDRFKREMTRAYCHLIMTLYRLDRDEDALTETIAAINLYPELKEKLEKVNLECVQDKISRAVLDNQTRKNQLKYKKAELNTKLLVREQELLRLQSTSTKQFIKELEAGNTEFFQKMLDQPTSKFSGLCFVHITDKLSVRFSPEEIKKLEEQQVILTLPGLNKALENADNGKDRYRLKYLKAGVEQLLLTWSDNNLKNKIAVESLDKEALSQLKELLKNKNKSSSETRKKYKEIKKSGSEEEALKNILSAWKSGELKDEKITVYNLLPSYKTKLDELTKALAPLKEAPRFKKPSSHKHHKKKRAEYNNTISKIRLITQRPPEQLTKDDYSKIIEALIKLIKDNNVNAEIYYLLASTYTRINNHKFALTNYNNAYNLRSDGTLPAGAESTLLANRGFTNYCLGKYPEAEQDYLDAIEKNNNDFYTHSNLGALYHKLRRYEEALKEHNIAIKLNCNVSSLWRRGSTYICLEIYDKALGDFNEVLKDLDPKHSKYVEILINKSIAERNLGLYEDAIRTLKLAIKRNPNNTDVYWNLGLVYEAFNKNKEACENYEKITALDPKNANAHYKVATIRMAFKQYSNAATSLDSAIQILLPTTNSTTTATANYGEDVAALETSAPDSDSLTLQPSDGQSAILKNLPASDEDKLLLAKVFDTLNLAKSSLLSKTFTNFIDLAIQIYPEYAEAYLHRALVYIKLKNYEAATADLNKAIELKLEDPLIYYYRGIIKYNQNNFSGALDDFNQALILAPDLTEVYSYLINTLKNLGQNDLATSFADKAINDYPSLALALGKNDLKSLKELLSKVKTEASQEIADLTADNENNEKALQAQDQKLLNELSRSKFCIAEAKRGNPLFFKNNLIQSNKVKYSGLCLIHLYADFKPAEIEQLTKEGAILTLDDLKNALINNDNCNRHYFKLLKIGIEQLYVGWKNRARNPNGLNNEEANKALDNEAIRNLKELLTDNQLDNETQEQYQKLLKADGSKDAAAANILERWKTGTIGNLDITFEKLLPFYSQSLAIIEKALAPSAYTPSFKFVR